MSDSQNRFRVSNDQTVAWFDRGATNYLASKTKVPLNTWTHIAVTGDASGLKIYVNGALDASNAAAYGAPNTGASFKIGAEAVEKCGMLILHLSKLDKNRQTKLRVKGN